MATASSDRTTQLAQAPIPGLLLRFSLPAIVGMMAQALYYVIDRVFIGRALGENGIAAITVAFPFMLIVMAFGMLIGFGATAQISIRLGQQNKSDAERILGNATVLLVLAALLITVVGELFLDHILQAFGARAEVVPLAGQYLHVIVLGTIFQTVGFGLNATIRGEGNPRVAMLSMLISVATNVVLAPIFLFGLGWGMWGAALATVIAQAVAAVWVVVYFFSGYSVLKFRRGNLRLHGPTCRQILAIGSPPFAMQIAASIQQSILNNQLNAYGGMLAISVMGIIYSAVMMFAMPIFGLTQGAQPIIGYNCGAGRFDRVKRVLEVAILAATCLTLAGFTVAMLWPAQMIGVFVKADPSLVALGTHAIHISCIMFPIVGFQIVSASYFQAVGKPRVAMFLLLSRQVLILIPAVLILPRFFGLDGVWASIPTADFCSSVLTGICLTFELRHLKARSLPTEPFPVLLESFEEPLP